MGAAVGVLLCALLTSLGGGTALAAPIPLHHTAPDRSVVTGGQGHPVKGLGIRLLEAPVSRRKDPRARTGVVDHLHPGTTISRHFEVSNTTNRPMRVALYAAAASIDNQSFTYAPDRTSNELTTWTTVEPAGVTLPPDSGRTARLTTGYPRPPGTASGTR